jgi:hypothetical protein
MNIPRLEIQYLACSQEKVLLGPDIIKDIVFNRVMISAYRA